MSRGLRDARVAGVYRDNLNALLRKVVAVGVAIGCPTMIVLTFVLGPDDPLVRGGYPPIVAYLGVYGWVLLRRPAQVVWFSRVTVVLFELGWLSWMVVRLRTADDVTDGWHLLFPTFFLGLIVFLLVSFLVMGTRAAMWHAAALMLAVLGAGLAGLLPRPGGQEHVLNLVRYVIFLAVIAILLQVLSQAKVRLAFAVAAAQHATKEAMQLRDMAYLDELTGLANRRRLTEELTFQAERVGEGMPVAVVYFDLDHFKEINDTHGHALGDRVLCLVAEIAARVVRTGDLVARVGGEEFVIVAPGTEHEQAVQLAERLRHILREEISRAVGGRITASFGVVTMSPGEPALAVLDRVDALMYAAKHGGRDRVAQSIDGSTTRA